MKLLLSMEVLQQWWDGLDFEMEGELEDIKASSIYRLSKSTSTCSMETDSWKRLWDVIAVDQVVRL